MPLMQGNLLLEALSARDGLLLAPYLQASKRSRGDVIFRTGDDVSHVNFPLQGTVVTLLVPMRDRRSIETATVGY